MKPRARNRGTGLLLKICHCKGTRNGARASATLGVGVGHRSGVSAALAEPTFDISPLSLTVVELICDEKQPYCAVVLGSFGEAMCWRTRCDVGEYSSFVVQS